MLCTQLKGSIEPTEIEFTLLRLDPLPACYQLRRAERVHPYLFHTLKIFDPFFRRMEGRIVAGAEVET